MQGRKHRQFLCELGVLWLVEEDVGMEDHHSGLSFSSYRLNLSIIHATCVSYDHPAVDYMGKYTQPNSGELTKHLGKVMT